VTSDDRLSRRAARIDEPPEGTTEAIKLTPMDLSIMRALQEDPRRTVANIAQRLRAPASTVRHRLNRLIKHTIIEFSVVTNPLQLGYRVWALIEIQAELAQVQALARRLAAEPEVSFVAVTTGGYDILIAAVFRSNEELYAFMTGHVSKLPGIIRTSTSTVLDLVKRTLAFRVPDQLGDSNRRAAKPQRGRRHRPR
jgi:Lrp/AsnC family transcriptional regulator for asnA, asnC and gidA